MNPYSDVASNMLLKDRVYNTLKNEIILGHLKPGQVLNIYELSAKMNISGAPVREALNMLGKDGFVSLAPRRSATVASATLRDWEVVAEMRLLLEPFAAKISTPDIPQSEIDNLRQRFSYLLTHPEDVYTHLEADRDLHRLLHAHADDRLAKLLELGDERGEVRVAGEDGKGVDVVLREANLHRVHGKADVGRVLAGVGAVRDLYELDAQLVEGRDGVREALPVAVGALRGDAALVDEALEDELDVGERAGLLVAATVAPPGAQGEVLKVDEHRDGALRVVGCVHEAGGSPCPA